MDIKELFKFIRKSKGYTQAEFGKVLGIGQPAVSDVETGKNNPSKTLVEFLKYRYSNIFIEEEQKEENGETSYKLIPQEVRKIKKASHEFAGVEKGFEFGKAVEKLRDIYSTKDPMLIHAISSNLSVFCETIDRKMGEQRALEELNVIKLRLEMDRRQGERRRQDLGPPGKNERRTGGDRRHFIRSSGEGI